MRADVEGRLLFDADPAWSLQVASLDAMTVLSPVSLPFLPFLLLEMLLLAQAFRRGVRLEQDRRLTV